MPTLICVLSSVAKLIGPAAIDRICKQNKAGKTGFRIAQSVGLSAWCPPMVQAASLATEDLRQQRCVQEKKCWQHRAAHTIRARGLVARGPFLAISLSAPVITSNGLPGRGIGGGSPLLRGCLPCWAYCIVMGIDLLLFDEVCLVSACHQPASNTSLPLHTLLG